MPSSRPCLRLLCSHLLLLQSLPLLAGLAGCAPASSDNSPGVESRASVSKPPLSEPRPALDIGPPTSASLAANPGSLASENGTESGDGPVVPVWMANELGSPDVALETGAQLEPLATVDPLIQALNDKEVGAEELFEENQDGNEGQENQDHEEEGEK